MPTNLMLGVALGSPAVSGVSIESQILSWPEIIAWWDYRVGLTLSVAEVAQWADRKSGYVAAQATSASRPTYSATGFGGGPGLVFDGTNDYLECTDANLLAALPDGVEAGSLLAVAKQDSLPTDAAAKMLLSYGGAASASRRSLGHLGNGSNINWAIGQTGDGVSVSTAAAVGFSGIHYVRVDFGATVTSVSIDGGAPGTANVVPATVNSRLRIGAISNTSPGNYLVGCGRHFVAHLPLSSEKQAIIDAYMMAQRTP